eukprot:1804431-Pleurochrysis_carterae.AAC.1
MPTISVARDALFHAIGKTYTEDEFEDLCFEFGIELDDIREEPVKATKTRGDGGESGAVYVEQNSASRVVRMNCMPPLDALHSK